MSMEIIGKPIHRVGGAERVSGAQRFVGDVKIPNTLHTRLVHLECARARIISIDTSEALHVPGVRGILTSDDLPDPVTRFGPAYQDRPLMAVGETKFHGEPVAIVAADTEHAAVVAASLVKVDYDELPAIFTISQALDPAAELVQDPSMT